MDLSTSDSDHEDCTPDCDHEYSTSDCDHEDSGQRSEDREDMDQSDSSDAEEDAEEDNSIDHSKSQLNPGHVGRRSYTREKKLLILKHYYQNNCNKYQTCKKFSISKPSLIRWIKEEEKIRSGKKGSKRVGGGRPPFWPDVEAKLVDEFQEMRQKGLKVKSYWFKARSFQLMKEMHPGAKFSFSQGWFDKFKQRNKISYRRATNIAQKTPADHEELIREFHRSIRRIAASKGSKSGLGKFSLSTIANVDQTPLPFTFNKGQGYDKRGTKTVWHQGAQSGLEKRQSPVQLTIFADGEPRVKPLVIFRGQGKRLSKKEKEAYDKRVVVKFQAKAWCDQEIMKSWVEEMWRRPISPDAQKPKLLIADVHRAQTTPVILSKLKKYKTEVVLVPPGLTNVVQPLDVAFNAEFKGVIDELQNDHMKENLDKYVNNGFTASDRRVLITKWVGEAWARRSEKKDTTQRAFKKCGISTAIDGSEDASIKIRGLEGYVVRNTESDSEEEEFELDTSDSESDSDES